MSTTSTNFNRPRKRRGQRVAEDERRRDSDAERSRDFYTESSRLSQPEDAKWSRNKLKQELSSLIAEFSYLTDTSKSQNANPASKDQSSANTPQPNLQVYAARTGHMNTPFENPDIRRRGVEWEDQQRDAVVYYVCSNNKPSRGRAVRRRGFKHIPKVKVRKSRSVRRSSSRDLSCVPRTRSIRRVRRRFSGFRASKSRSPKRRSRSCHSLMPFRRRVRSHSRRRSRSPSCSRSCVKDMPFRYRRRGTREIVVKSSKPKVIYKTIEPCDEPTLVTLFPKRIKRSRRRLRSRSREPELPCKCAMCANKYRSLARLCRDPCFDPCAPCLPMCAPYNPMCAPMCAPRAPICAPCPPSCNPCSPICSPCTQKYQMTPLDCGPCSPNWICNAGGVMCNCLYANQCFNGDCYQPLANRCVKSVCFKFGTVDQCIDNNITHYFQSILDRRLQATERNSYVD